VPDPRELRASNDDRERVAKVLHDAMAEGRLTVSELEERLDKLYAAKTFGELEPLTRDLPVARPSPEVAQPRQVAPQSTRIGGRGTSTVAVAFMSGAQRRGTWTVPPTFNAIAVMGGVELDLTKARFEEAETIIHAYALMGGIEIVVPEDITVHVTGVGFMGAFDDQASNQGPPGGPVVRITGLALMGGVDVRHPKPSRPNPRPDRPQLES
jgi:hypothetical protein